MNRVVTFASLLALAAAQGRGAPPPSKENSVPRSVASAARNAEVPATLPTSAPSGPRIVAWVNNTAVTQADQEKLFRAHADKLGDTQAIDPEQRRRLLCKVLDGRIDQLVLLREAERVVSSGKQKKLSKQAEKLFQNKLDQEKGKAGAATSTEPDGVERERRIESIRDTLLIQELMKQQLVSKLRVRPEEMRHFYNEHQQDYYEPARATFRAIMIDFKYFQTPEQAGRFAINLLQRIQQGEDFAALAEKYSLGPTAEKGGLWEDVPEGSLQGDLDRAVFGADAGSSPKIAATEEGLAIVKLLRHTPGAYRPFADVKVQREITERVGTQMYETMLKTYLEDVRRRTRIDILLPDYVGRYQANKFAPSATIVDAVHSNAEPNTEAHAQGELPMGKHPMGPILLAAMAGLASSPQSNADLIYFAGQKSPVQADVISQDEQFVVLRVPRAQLGQIVPERSSNVSAKGVRANAAAAVAPTEPSQEAPAEPEVLDGTWIEDDRFVTLKVRGQEFRFHKQGLARRSGSFLSRQMDNAGSVWGRIRNGDRPLGDCEVMMVPMKERKRVAGLLTNSDAVIDPQRETLNAVTDQDGVYRFEDVPAGHYKLFWRPKSSEQWIRRVTFRPDVMVHARKNTQIKDVAVALKTIN